MRELPHSHLPELLGQELDRPLGAIWDWRAYFSSALLRNAPALHCCDFGWLISWPTRFTAVPRLGNDGFQNFHLHFREVPGITIFFFLRHISPWVFSAVARQTGLNKIVEFNSSPTRGTVFALGCRTQSVPKSLMRELLHSSLPVCLAESWAGCLWLIAVRRAHSRPALPRNSHDLHCFDFGLLIHWPLQLQLNYVLDYGFLHFRLQFHVATWLFSVECPGFRGSLSRELLWRINSGGR